MRGHTTTVRSRDGGKFDCYLVIPESDDPVPAIVLASAVHGVDADIRAIADEFGAHGFIAAAPDLFWRGIPGPLPHDDERAGQRSQPRLERIKAGENDMADTLAYLRTLPTCNGRAVAMGFCYGGPYAILGPKRLGYLAGIACHGTRMLDYIHELEGVDKPVCIIWGDRDSQAPAMVLDAYRGLASRTDNLEVRIFPGVLHAYMMRGRPEAFDARAYDFSMARARKMLDELRGADAARSTPEAGMASQAGLSARTGE
jgi:carboxymethylenebutenolidase